MSTPAQTGTYTSLVRLVSTAACSVLAVSLSRCNVWYIFAAANVPVNVFAAPGAILLNPLKMIETLDCLRRPMAQQSRLTGTMKHTSQI